MTDRMVTVSVTLPASVWKDWDEDCKENFGDVRYVKMMFDHKFRKEFEKLK